MKPSLHELIKDKIESYTDWYSEPMVQDDIDKLVEDNIKIVRDYHLVENK